MLSAAAQPSRLPLVAVLASLLALSTTVVSGAAAKPIAALVIVTAIVAAMHHALSRWHSLVGAIVLIILFVPIKRYTFAGVGLPFDLEPYRIAVAIVIGLWLSSLLIDQRVVLRRSGLEGPLLLLAAAVIGSLVTNLGGIAERGIADSLTKELLFLLSYFLVFFLIVSVIHTPARIDTVLKILVSGAAIVALFAILERRTRYNIFNHLEPALPLLEFRGAIGEEGISRGGRLRTYASAQHPIALAAMLVMVAPLALYLYRQTLRRIWMAACVLIVFGALTTVSRTSITMIVTSAIVFLWLQPQWIKRSIPFLLPALIVIHLALPGVIGGIRQSFFPPQGLLEQQTAYGGRASGKRLGPQFSIVSQQPAFGQGFGTRVTTGPERNALVLDNQWLGTAVETGLIGIFAWLWIFLRTIRSSARIARHQEGSERGLLLTAVAASTSAFAIGMFTYDAFSFIQVTFVLFILLAIGAATRSYRGDWPAAPIPRRTRHTA